MVKDRTNVLRHILCLRHECKYTRLKDISIRDFRFGPLARAHRTLLLPSTQRNLSLEQAPAKIAGSHGSFCPSDQPRLLPRNRLLRHLSGPPPWASDFAAAIGVLPARDRQRPDPPQHLAKQAPVQMSLGQQQPVVPGSALILCFS